MTGSGRRSQASPHLAPRSPTPRYRKARRSSTVCPRPATATRSRNTTSEAVTYTPPALVTGLAAVSTSPTSITLTWTDASARETGYRIERRVHSDAFAPIATVIPGSTTFVDTGLIEGTLYDYQVVGTTEQAESAALDTTAQTQPATPTDLAATSPVAGTIQLTWTDSSANETGFEILRSADGEQYESLGTVGADVTTFDDGTAGAGMSYFYEVRAVQTIDGPATEPVVGLSRPAAPVNLEAVAHSADSTISLTWSPTVGASGYLVEASTDGGTTWSPAGTPTETAFEFSGTESTDVQLRVTATNDSGDGVASEPVESHVPPLPATNLSIHAVNPFQVDINWTGASQSATQYKVYRAVGAADFSLLTDALGNVSAFSDTDTFGGQNFAYYLVANDGTSDSDPSEIVEVKTMPEAVDNLIAVSSSSSTVDLSWSTSYSAESYSLERSSDGGNHFDELSFTSSNTFTDDNADEATSYVYRVVPVGDGGEGPGATVAVTTLPAKASEVSVVEYTDTSVTLSWSDNSGGEDGYEVARSTDGELWTVLTTTAADTQTYTDSTATEATQYVYRIRSVNAAGFGEAATAVMTTRPAAPSNLIATGDSATQVTLTWNDNSDGETRYFLYRSDDGGTTFSSVGDGALDASSDSFVDDNVTAGTTYQYKVQGEGLGGESAESNTATITTVPAAVTNLSAQGYSTTELSLMWGDVQGNDSYTIQRREASGQDPFVDVATDLDADQTTYFDSTAVEGTTYQYRIIAVNAGGSSEASNIALITTMPAAPTNLAGTASSASTIALSWTDNSSGETAVTVQRFDGENWETIASLPANTESYVDTVPAGSTQSYRVFMVNGGGESGYAEALDVTAYPAPAELVSAVSSSPTQIDIAWQSTNGATSYKVVRSDDGGANFSDVSGDLDSTTLEFSDSTVTESTAYQYKVIATNDGGSATSEAISVISLPAAPTNLVAAGVSVNGVDLTWTDNSAHEDGFVIEQSSDAGETWTLAATPSDVASSGNTGLATVTGGVEGTDYLYRIRSVYSQVESANSDTASATTIPAAPTNFAVSSVTAASVSLSWSDNSEGETDYVIERSVDNGNSFLVLETLPADANGYTDTDVSEDSVYVYRIQAERNGTGSPYSESITTATHLIAPAGVTAIAAGPTSVDLSWTDASTAESSYELERSTDGGNTWSPLTTTLADVETSSDTSAPESPSSSTACGRRRTTTPRPGPRRTSPRRWPRRPRSSPRPTATRPCRSAGVTTAASRPATASSGPSTARSGPSWPPPKQTRKIMPMRRRSKTRPTTIA